MKTLFYTISFLILYNFSLTAQEKKGIDTWNVGIGAANTLMHGDLTSVNNLDKSLINMGFYLYVDKMFTPAFGFELKGQSLQFNGYSQELSAGYPIAYTNYNSGDLYFEGDSFGGELNLLINLNGLANNPYATKERKFNFTTYFGIGYHSYNSELYSYTDLDGVGFSYTPQSNTNKNSMYYTAGIGVRYYLNKRLDIELRQTFNFNSEDDLDAAVTQKQVIESFYTTQLGLVIKLFKKDHQNIIWDDKANFSSKDIDTDDDGVVNRFDKEENTPKGAKVYADGSAVDSDKDGIIDFYDKCPLKFGTKEREGCPIDKEIDTDGDLVPDYIDKEIDTPKGAKVYADGVAIDTDKDGVIDLFDKCLLLKGEKELDGCPKDTDGDGIYDEFDLCPNIKGDKVNNGCPNALSEKENVELVKLAKNIFFDNGKSFLRESSKRELEKVSKIMIVNPNLNFIIEGHTDSGGKSDYNMKLSQERANAVKMYLIRLKVKPNKLKAIGYGFTRPKYNNSSSSGRQLNRRVEINVDDNSVRELINTKTHLVRKEDTLFSIAKKYNITVEELKQWNGLISNTIIIGDRLIINKK
jgi:outer membrane protein OmpA-like peptidoglycan-associated protein